MTATRGVATAHSRQRRRVLTVLAAGALTACQSSASTHRDGAVLGTVLSAPSCPVERSDTPCPPRPVRGAVVEAVLGDQLRATTHSDGAGRFRLSLPYGTYTIRATNPGALRTTATRSVRLDRATVSVRLVVDSGIR